MYVAHISHVIIQFTFVPNYLKNVKVALRNSRLLDQFFVWVISLNSRTGKYSENVCQEGNTIITNVTINLNSRYAPFSDTALIVN